MLSTLEYSIRHFCEHILKLKIEEASKVSGDFYGASVPIIGNKEGEYDFYVFFHKETLNEFAKVLFRNGSINMKEDDLCDLCKECANQIIGYAKNLLNDSQGHSEYTLGIPEYLGNVDFSNIKLDQELTFKLKNSCFRIGYKKS